MNSTTMQGRKKTNKKSTQKVVDGRTLGHQSKKRSTRNAGKPHRHVVEEEGSSTSAASSERDTSCSSDYNSRAEESEGSKLPVASSVMKEQNKAPSKRTPTPNKATSKKARVETQPQVDMVNATGLQKNTSAAVQSHKHGGDFARCNNRACKHGVGSSECTWNAGQCGHTRQWSSCQVSQCPNWKGLCQRVQPHSPMGGQAPDMALDNEIEVDAQLKVRAGCRMQQRASKRAIEFEAQERKEKGLPCHKVQVTRHGKIDGACEGKDAWDGAIRSLAPRILNMAAVRVTE